MLRNLALAAVLGFGLWHYWTTRPISHAPGILAANDPVQVNLDAAAPFVFRGHQVTPLADFAVEARVLGIERYRIGREAEVSPVDLALGWGPMSDETVLQQLRISQSNRFYHYAWSNEPPLPPAEIVTHSANMHMIPADSAIEKRLGSVRPGHVVEIRGKLVRVDSKDNWHWVSSLTRGDGGAGACELVWVEEMRVR